MLEAKELEKEMQTKILANTAPKRGATFSRGNQQNDLVEEEDRFHSDDISS